MTEPVQISVQATPNPNSMKFVLDRQASDEMKSYMSKEEAAGDPLGEALFAIDGVDTVFMMADFVSVNKTPEADWAELIPQAEEAIRAHL